MNRHVVGIGAGVAAAGLLWSSVASANRSQLQPAANTETALVASPMLGANEVPTPGDPDARGEAAVTINTTTGQVCINMRTERLDETLGGLHIHEGATGVAGPVRVNFLVTTGREVAKCVDSTPAQAAAIVANPSNFYVNGHTATYPDGALRAQLSNRGAAAGELLVLPEPLRAYDSRQGTDGKVAPATPRLISLAEGRAGGASTASLSAVPPGARAALVTLTVTQTEGGGFGVLYSNSLTTVPAISTINWTSANSDIATTTTVAVDGAGRVRFATSQNSTHVIVDVIGYYV